MEDVLIKIKKLLSMAPRDIWMRLGSEIGPYIDNLPPGEIEKKLSEKKLLCLLGVGTFGELHSKLNNVKMPWCSNGISLGTLENTVPGESEKIIKRAELVLSGYISIFGPDPFYFESIDKIDWYRDYKSNLSWPFDFFHNLDPADLHRKSDVKFPWELSRLQWLIPVAQAWKLTGDNRYAEFTQQVLSAWINKNPYGWGINWGCTMEPAMRIFTWCWFYQLLSSSPAWQNNNFQFQFIRSLYLHLKFVNRYIEITDINGNHLTADAASLIVGGVFLRGKKTISWAMKSWKILKREIFLQVYDDGVDFEGSVPYHRLVAEFFHVGAESIEELGVVVPKKYSNRLIKMAEYIEAYTRPDGLCPVFGDNDNARTLPMCSVDINDHRYLPSIIRRRWAPETLSESWRESASECLWWWGSIPSKTNLKQQKRSIRFQDGGAYILRNNNDYIYFDCGPLGLKGRGGHGHNDMLAFEAVLKGCSIVTDPGCLVYTGNHELRNSFRSTYFHSTPQIENYEINRFISPLNMWFLHGDGNANELAWHDDPDYTLAIGSHDGYSRLQPPVIIQRNIILDKNKHALAWKDQFIGAKELKVSTTLQLASNVKIKEKNYGNIHIVSGGQTFVIEWEDAAIWEIEVQDGMVAPHYGEVLPAKRLRWKNKASTNDSFVAGIYPEKNSETSFLESISERLGSFKQ